MSRRTAAASFAIAAVFTCTPTQAGVRAFVSSGGNDANVAAGCTLASPCRTFQAAHTAVDAGGTIVALDAAGYAPVTITKSVRIVGNPGALAAIAVTSGNGVTIATPGVNVLLRHVGINGIGGDIGIHMTAGSALSVENCVMSNLNTGLHVNAAADVRIVNSVFRANANFGALVEGAASASILSSQFLSSATGLAVRGGASADVANSHFMGNTADGLLVHGNTVTTSRVAVSDSVASDGGSGFRVLAESAGALIRASFMRVSAAGNTSHGLAGLASDATTVQVIVGQSMLTGNGVGLRSGTIGTGVSTVESLGNNMVRQNGTDTLGTIVAVPAL